MRTRGAKALSPFVTWANRTKKLHAEMQKGALITHWCQLCSEAGSPSEATRVGRSDNFEELRADGIEAHWLQCEYSHEHALDLTRCEFFPITDELLEIIKAERVLTALEKKRERNP